MDYGKSFKFYRQKANLTQKEAAELIGVKDYQLGNYETNRSQPSLEVLIKMSKTYLVSIDKMLGNNMFRNKHEKEHPELYGDEYIDADRLMKLFNDFIKQNSNENK